MSFACCKFAGFLIVALSVGTSLLVTQEAAPEKRGDNDAERWRILVTNDDGIESSGLIELVKALAEHGDVVVYAPDSNRSGASQSVPSLNRPMTAKNVEVTGASVAIAVGGSPADAVCYGVFVLGKDRPFDLVV